MINQLLPSPAQDLSDDQILGLYGRSGPGVWVRFNFVSTLDGAATHDGVSGPLGNDGDRRIFALTRRQADVILVGAGTIRAEGYEGPLLDDAGRDWRIANGYPGHPALAIVSGSLDLDPCSGLFTRSPVRPIVFTSERASARRREAFSDVADVVVLGEETVDGPACAAWLGGRGLNGILCEGGPTLFAGFVRDDAVDELCLSLSPLLSGGRGRGVGADTPAGDLRRMRLASLLESDSALYGRWLRP
ncbi:dihydrofolate reductase family protein [Arthrobacter sp. H5]|uniref:dihydrofolate reductase family protein n=1 Tax=Arthrobacter sp. H5 TaxID=1267973 RepID=UPI0004AEC7E3|nr:dihydrofolate reductase family protein [Arthrobacter sp. H5]